MRVGGVSTGEGGGIREFAPCMQLLAIGRCGARVWGTIIGFGRFWPVLAHTCMLQILPRLPILRSVLRSGSDLYSDPYSDPAQICTQIRLLVLRSAAYVLPAATAPVPPRRFHAFSFIARCHCHCTGKKTKEEAEKNEVEEGALRKIIGERS